MRQQCIPKFLDDAFLSGASSVELWGLNLRWNDKWNSKDENVSGQDYGHNIGIFSKFLHPAHVNLVNSTVKTPVRVEKLHEKHFSSSRSSCSLRINGTCLNMPNYMFFFLLLEGRK